MWCICQSTNSVIQPKNMLEGETVVQTNNKNTILLENYHSPILYAALALLKVSSPLDHPKNYDCSHLLHKVILYMKSWIKHKRNLKKYIQRDKLIIHVPTRSSLML